VDHDDGSGVGNESGDGAEEDVPRLNRRLGAMLVYIKWKASLEPVYCQVHSWHFPLTFLHHVTN
jgi:hypothetical protein